MALFSQKPKTHETITAPLRKMVDDLVDHITSHQGNIVTLNDEKKRLDEQISVSENEISSSEHSVKKIKELIGQ